MDLIGGYGSGSESEGGDSPSHALPPSANGVTGQRHSDSPAAMAPTHATGPVAASRPSAASAPNASKSLLFANMPPPSSGSTGILLPPPTASVSAPGQKKLVRLPLPLLAAALDSDEDDQPAAKRIKPTGAKSKLLDFLPPPKHDLSSAGAGMLARPKKAPPSAAMSDAAGPGASGANAGPGHAALPGDFFAAGYSNEAFRVADDGGGGDGGRPAHAAGPSAGGAGAAAALGAGAHHPEHHHAAGDPQQYAQYYDPQQYAQYYAHQHQQYGELQGPAVAPTARPRPEGAAAGGDMSADAIFEEAMRAEQERAARRGGGGAAGAPRGVKLVEINAKDLTKVDPTQRQSTNAVRDALGSGYVAQLRSAAQEHEGNKLARRKHQIGTLFHNAKLRELEVLEKSGQGMKSKAETAAKYGW